MAGTAVILATLDGIDPAGKKPLIVIGKVPTNASPAENEQVNEREMRSVPGFREAPVTERRNIPFAGGTGNLISAAANDRTVMQFIRVLPGGSLVRLLATGDTAAIEGARRRFSISRAPWSCGSSAGLKRARGERATAG